MNKINLIIILSLLFLSCKKAEKFSSFNVEKEIHFGSIKASDSVTKTFTLTNTSDTPLVISKIGTSCGCTGAIISDSIANKNEAIKIKASFKPRPGEFGDVNNSIVVEANTNPPYTALYLKGKVDNN